MLPNPMEHPAASAGEPGAGAWIVLPGHRDAEAPVQVVPLGLWSRVARTAALAAGWGVAAVASFLVTVFDPFLGSIPVLVGGFSVYRSWKGHYVVISFRGGCPRCGHALRLKAGARIGVPHPMVCYSCHHEGELLF